MDATEILESQHRIRLFGFYMKLFLVHVSYSSQYTVPYNSRAFSKPWTLGHSAGVVGRLVDDGWIWRFSSMSRKSSHVPRQVGPQTTHDTERKEDNSDPDRAVEV